jgi:hypothetical protein
VHRCRVYPVNPADDEPELLNFIDADLLAAVVPGFASETLAKERSWKVQPLVQGGGESVGVYRISGTTPGPEGAGRWSVILKVLAPASPADEGRWNSAQREYHAYGYSDLQTSPGTVMPLCLSRMLRPDGTVWLWLEDVSDDEVWPLSRYRLAAYHLGRFNGHFAEAGTPRSMSWLSRRWLRGWLEEAGPAIVRLQDLRRDSVLSPVYQDVEGILRLWSERDRRLDLLESFPQTLCHLDVHRRNMFSRRRGAEEQTVLIDWAFVGRAAVGEELAALVSATVAFGDVSVDDIAELESGVLAGYLAGLRDAGYRADPEQVWAAYSLAASLRLPVGAVRLVLPLLLEPGRHIREQQQHDRPLAELFARWAAMNTHLIALGNGAVV